MSSIKLRSLLTRRTHLSLCLFGSEILDDQVKLALAHYERCLPEKVTVKRIRSIPELLSASITSIIVHQLPFDHWILRTLGFYSVNVRVRHAPWNWVNAANRVRTAESVQSEQIVELRKTLRSKGRSILLLGSGPSLKNFILPDRDMIVIGANSLVADEKILERVKPDILVASDAAMHFSETSHAVEFRKKLQSYLARNSTVWFVYPQTYDAISRAYLSEHAGQLAPIPTRRFSKDLRSMQRTGKLPVGENVLSHVLLPLALDLQPFGPIYFAGFDGQPEGESGIWKSEESLKISEVDDLKSEYPALAKSWENSRMASTDFPKRFLRQFRRLQEEGVQMCSLTLSYHSFLSHLPGCLSARQIMLRRDRESPSNGGGEPRGKINFRPPA